MYILSIAAFGIEIDVQGTFPLCNRISIIRYTLLLIYFLLDVFNNFIVCVLFHYAPPFTLLLSFRHAIYSPHTCTRQTHARGLSMEEQLHNKSMKTCQEISR